MGCCAPSSKIELEAVHKSKDLTRRLERDKDADGKYIKLLILGAGESGKSTLFKQLIQIHGNGFSENERKEYIQSIFQNCISCVQTLITESDLLPANLGTRLPDKYAQEKKFVAELDSRLDSVTPEVAMQLRKFWKQPAIQETYLHRSMFQLPDCAKYFLDRLDEIEKEDYTPTEQDVFRCRIPTTGVVEIEFSYGGNTFRMYDVGGQRNERKKWIHCFDRVTAVIFVASMSDYDQKLFEDSRENRMSEALLLFEEICNSSWFKSTSIILFLNKSDLFAEKIRTSPLNALFPDYTGGSNFEAGADFLTEKFKEVNRVDSKLIYTYVTNATDTDLVRNVFETVSEIIIRRNMKKSGMI